MDIASLVIALLFLAVTMTAGYGLFYLTVGRQLRARKAAATDRAKPVKKETKEEKDAGIARDAYCYPKINDTMGFDFVRVIQVDGPSSGKEEKAVSWESSSSAFLVPSRPAVTAMSGRGEDDAEPPFRRDDGPRRAAPGRAGEDDPEYSGGTFVDGMSADDFLADLQMLHDMSLPESPSAYHDEEEDIALLARGMEKGMIVDDGEEDDGFGDVMDAVQGMSFEDLYDEAAMEESNRKAEELMTMLD